MISCLLACGSGAWAQTKSAPTPAAKKSVTPPADSKKGASASAASKPVGDDASAAQPGVALEKPKTVYVVPMGIKEKGQFGLDIHPMVYEQVAKDIEAKRPDVVVFVLNSADIDAVRYLGDDPSKFGIFNDDQIRPMTRDLKAVMERVGAEPIMIIRDAVGYSALLGLSWPNMYMTDSARLMGLSRIQERTGAPDVEVQRKYREAFVGICNGFLVSGGYNPSIGLAMMRPEKMLSASFQGREIVWTEDNKGTWVVDGDEKEIRASFNAEMAEELGLSDGTVSDDEATMIEDLMYQRGYRSYERMAQDGEILVVKYIEGWRKALEECRKAYPEYGEALESATGKDEKKFLSKAKGLLEKVLAAIKKYPAVGIKLEQDFGVSKLALETELLKLQERIRGLSKSAPTTPSGGSGGRGRGFGPGSGISID